MTPRYFFSSSDTVMETYICFDGTISMRQFYSRKHMVHVFNGAFRTVEELLNCISDYYTEITKEEAIAFKAKSEMMKELVK